MGSNTSTPIRPVRGTISSRTHTHRSYRLDLCLHLITFGSYRGPPEIPIPIILHLDISTMRPPSRDLRQRYTGASPRLAAYFFSLPGHESYYRSMLAALRDQLLEVLSDPEFRRSSERHGSRCVAVMLNCRAGMHRSVAVAERLARDVESWRWRGLRVGVEHLDTDIERGIKRERRARAGRCGIRTPQNEGSGARYQAGHSAGRYGE